MAVGVGAVAVGLELVFAWPQAVDAVRSPDIGGVSPVTAVLMVLTGLSWLGYGIVAGDPVVIVANAVMAVATLVIAGALAARRAMPARVALALVGPWAVVATAAFALWGAVGLGTVGAALGIGMGVPQAVHAVRSGTVAGVAISSYVMLAGLQAAWLVYGLLVADTVIVVPNVIALPVSLSVVAVLLLRSTRAMAPTDLLVDPAPAIEPVET